MADFIRSFVDQWTYLGVALMMLLETVFPPVPSELIMPLAGLESARGNMTLWGTILAGTAGAMVGNYLWYLLARLAGLDRFHHVVDRFGRLLTLTWKEVKRGDRLFDKYNRWFVFLGRMIPTIRSLVSIPAGLFGMRTLPFLFWSTLGTAGWTTMLAVAGYLLRDEYEKVGTYVNPVSDMILAGLVLTYLYRVFTWKPHTSDDG